MPGINLWVTKTELRRFVKKEIDYITGLVEGAKVPQKKKKKLHNFDWKSVYMHRNTKDGCITLKRRHKEN
jgi:hypothetical protein